MLGQGLPQPRIEVSGLYYDYKFRQRSVFEREESQLIDLRFDTMMRDLGLPMREAHDAINDAVMAGLAFIKLRQLGLEN
jgi:DNA polymerase-3 subunit epsilon